LLVSMPWPSVVSAGPDGRMAGSGLVVGIVIVAIRKPGAFFGE